MATVCPSLLSLLRLGYYGPGPPSFPFRRPARFLACSSPCSLFPAPCFCCLKIEVFQRHNRALGLQCTVVPARGVDAVKSAVICILGPAFRVGEIYMTGPHLSASGLGKIDAPASAPWLRVPSTPSCLLRFVASGQTWPALTGHSAHRFSAHHRRQTMLTTMHK